MSNSQVKRNVIALMIAAPIIFLLSLLTDFFDQNDALFDWFHVNHGGHSIFHEGDNLERIVNLRGEWQFRKGDNLEWASPQFDDDEWDDIQVPGYWEQQNHDNYDGFAWYRRSFDIDDEYLNRALFFDLGQVDDVDEVYFNGQRIGGKGSFPPTYTGAFDQYRHYGIPASLIKDGENLIAIRVYDAQMGGGIYRGDIGIYASSLPPMLVNLEGEWQFKTKEGDAFEKIQVPGNWESQGYPHYDGMAWYQKSFSSLDVPSDEALILLLGRIDDTDEVKLNGELIGRTGTLSQKDLEIDSDYYAIERRYEFPASLLRDVNTLEIRIHDSGGEGGIYQGPVGIVSKKAFNEALNN